MKALLHSVYDQPDAASVHAQFDRIVDALAEKLPAVAEHLEQARADILAFTAYPKELWRQIWSNNPQERLNREIRRAPTWSASSPTATRSSASSAPCSPNNTTNGPKAAGTGVQVSSGVTPSYGPQSFGHDGAGGQTGMADAKLKIGVGYTRNRLSMVDLTLPLVP